MVADMSNRDDEATKNRAREKLSGCTDPLEKLRYKCLARGASGIKNLGRLFKIADDNMDKTIDSEEFLKLIQTYDVDLDDDEIKQLFNDIDKDGSGKICFEEFLAAVRPPMSEARKNIIGICFKEMDVTGDGVITIEDLRKKYKAREHQKYKNGEWTEEQVFQQFMKSFGDADGDGKISASEFLNYYSGVSLSVDSDTYFDLMMRNAYKLSAPPRRS